MNQIIKNNTNNLIITGIIILLTVIFPQLAYADAAPTPEVMAVTVTVAFLIFIIPAILIFVILLLALRYVNRKKKQQKQQNKDDK